MPGKRKRRDRSPSLSSDSKENIDYDDQSGSEDSLDLGSVASNLPNSQESIVNSQQLASKSNYVECGIIKSLRLVNFMCHGNFEIELGPRINFIIGRNGSGKSAILTALVLVLGGRASNTSRGQSFKSFIKTGETKAKITVKLNNYNGIERSSSFKYDTYGDVIIIERVLKSEGSSTYAIKSKSGKVVSNKKDELNAIVKHFNIQVNNPITILNQEISRNFLNSKNPRDKYTFFMQATQLEEILNDYAYAREKTNLTGIELEKKKALLKDVKAELKELEKKVHLFSLLDDQNKKLDSLDQEMDWAMVREAEAEVESWEKDKDVSGKKGDELKANVEKITTSIERMTTEKQELFQEIESKVDENNALKQKREEEKKIIHELKEKRSQISFEGIRFKQEIDNLKIEEKNFLQRIAELKKQYGDPEKSEEEKRIRLEMIQKLEIEENQLKAEMKTKTLHSDQLTGSIQTIREQIRRAEDEIRELKSRIFRMQNEIRNFVQSKTNQLRRFGSYMPDLVKSIEQAATEGKFKQKPLGPIGAHIKLKKPEAALAVESCLKNLIIAFCCDNQDDARVLLQLMQRLIGNARPPVIITRKFTKRHAVAQHGIRDAHFSSILDLLEIEDDPIANVLIDRANIESVAYIDNEDEALDVMTKPEKVPMNCNQAYTRIGTNMYPQTRHKEFKNYKPLQKQPRYLARDIDILIQDLEMEISQDQKDLQAKEKSLAPVKQNLRENESDLSNTKEKLREMNQRVNDIGRELETLKAIEGEDKPVEVSAFEEDLQVVLTKMAETREKLGRVKEEHDSIKSEIEAASERSRNYQEKIELNQDVMSPLGDKTLHLEEKINNLKRTLAKYQAQLEATNGNISEIESKIAEKKREFEILRDAAMARTGRELQTKRSSEDIKKEISEIKTFMKEQEKEIGDREKINKQYNNQITRFKDTLNQVDAIESLLTEFEIATKLRLREYLALRKRITNKACLVFKVALEALNFSGALEVNHEEHNSEGVLKKAKTLEIKINPKVMVNQDTYKDTRSLSGGERSYGTVAFLVALWESCNSPFRMLDEVDVFMDVVTRSTAMQILVENAKMKAGKQYIFLSPLGVVVDEKFAHVHRMPDPVRGRQPADGQ